jgi:hypothetical protein
MSNAETTSTGHRAGTGPTARSPHPAVDMATPGAWLPTSEDAVAAIAQLTDVEVRNLWITQTYADLAQRLARAIPSDHTWCTFAVWASSTAGQSIREEELGATVAALLAERDDHRAAVADANRSLRWLSRLGVVTLLDATHLDALLLLSVDVVRDRIAHGNTIVFGELAPLFVRLLEVIETGQAMPGAEDVILHRIGLEPDDDDDLVARAFRLYLEAATEPYSSRRSQKVLAANIWAVLHEQQRLQTDIAESMDSGFIVVDDIAFDHVHHRLPGRVSRAIAQRVLAHLEQPVRTLFQEAATATMMQLHTPGLVLHLGRTLPPLPSGEMFPRALQDIDLPTLHDALGEWDRTGGTGYDCGATDWCDLQDRMSYIVNLFRSRQHTASLAQPPFSSGQLDEMRELRIPAGPLLPS